MVSPPIYQDCLRCHKPLTPESLTHAMNIQGVTEGEPLVYGYRHNCESSRIYYSKAFHPEAVKEAK